jgi:hypothetical protein
MAIIGATEQLEQLLLSIMIIIADFVADNGYSFIFRQ